MPKPSGTEAAICEDLSQRQAKGISKYGQTVAGNPLTLRQWLQHAYEECLDQSVYLRRAIEEMDNPNPEFDVPLPTRLNQADCWNNLVADLMVDYGLEHTEPGSCIRDQVMHFLHRKLKEAA